MQKMMNGIAALTLTVLCGLQVVVNSHPSVLLCDNSQRVSEKVLPCMLQIGIAQSGNVKVQTVGSAVIVRSDGYALTAKHTVTTASHVFVKDVTGQQYSAIYFMADANRDLAVLHFAPLPTQPLRAIRIGGTVSAGQEIMAFGFPAATEILGLSATVSKGVVSGVDRVLEEPGSREESEKPERKDDPKSLTFFTAKGLLDELFGHNKAYTEHMLQIDAMVNPGSSGGAVVDMNGELVGVMHSIISNTGSSIGLNFAIPVSEASTILGSIPPKEKN
jgi:S1-C subfamily serine protease